jgi:hypothetical protein
MVWPLWLVAVLEALFFAACMIPLGLWCMARGKVTSLCGCSVTEDEASNIAAYPRVSQAGGFALSHGLTAVCCENLFSAAGFASNGRRSRIGSKRLDMQLFEHWNRRFGSAEFIAKK